MDPYSRHSIDPLYSGSGDRTYELPWFPEDSYHFPEYKLHPMEEIIPIQLHKAGCPFEKDCSSLKYKYDNYLGGQKPKKQRVKSSSSRSETVMGSAGSEESSRLQRIGDAWNTANGHQPVHQSGSDHSAFNHNYFGTQEPNTQRVESRSVSRPKTIMDAAHSKSSVKSRRKRTIAAQANHRAEPLNRSVISNSQQTQIGYAPSNSFYQDNQGSNNTSRAETPYVSQQLYQQTPMAEISVPYQSIEFDYYSGWNSPNVNQSPVCNDPVSMPNTDIDYNLYLGDGQASFSELYAYLGNWNDETPQNHSLNTLTAEVAVNGGVWAQSEAPRRSVSMMHDPRYFYNQQKAYNYNEPMPSCAQYNDGNFYPPQPSQQNGNFYQEAANCASAGDEPVYDPKRRFSPPMLDSPMAAHRNDMSFNGGTIMLDSNNQPAHAASGYQNHFPQSLETQKYERRKISVQANFYNYNMPFEDRPTRDSGQANYGGVREMEPWRKMSAQGVQMMTQPLRKYSQPAEKILTNASNGYNPPQGFQTRMMLSPQATSKPREVTFSGEAPMEVEPMRKKSSTKEQQPLSRKNSAPRRHANVPTRKASQMATKSQLRTPRFGETTTKYTAPPILNPMRNGTGLYWQACKGLAVSSSGQSAPAADINQINSGQAVFDDAEMSDDSPSLKIDESPGPKTEPEEPETEKTPQDAEMPSLPGPSETPPTFIPQLFNLNNNDGEKTPSRKKGFFFMAAQMAQPNFAEELEALRKESYASTSSRGEDAYRKLSNNFGSRKDSNASIEQEEEQDDIIIPVYSDAVPHINIGSPYQARVFKWRERDITNQERDAIEDKDFQIFDSLIMEGLDVKQIEAYELLACSAACPTFGKNKELALHLLMENRGNIESAVADLLRSDTLDWEQYPIVYQTNYTDGTKWAPHEIDMFQEAMYKSEKDFHQVAEDIRCKSVKECIEFYYNWKKNCPDDYRKLRNLRRKRQLLEANLHSQAMAEEEMKRVTLEEKNPTPMEEGETETKDGEHPAFQGLQDYLETRPRPHASSFSGLLAMAPRRAEQLRSLSPKTDLVGLSRAYQPSVPRASITSSSKKGAQPSADGFFHCRLCDKCFEKVKSLNAHMKSHAMKARAEAEAKAQVESQMAAQLVAPVQQLAAPTPQMPVVTLSSLPVSLPAPTPTFPTTTLTLGSLPASLQASIAQGLTQGISPAAAATLSLSQNLLNTAQSLQALPAPIARTIPSILQQHINQTTQIIN